MMALTAVISVIMIALRRSMWKPRGNASAAAAPGS